MSALTTPGVFGIDDLDGLRAFFAEHGFAILRGLLDEPTVDVMELECVGAQHALVAGELAERHGTVMLVDDADGTKTSSFANYVLYIEELSPAVRATVDHPVMTELMTHWLGPECWTDPERFGVVYQDARAGRESSYTRIGWHSDWQSGPNLDIWPSVAFTFHIDAT